MAGEPIGPAPGWVVDDLQVESPLLGEPWRVLMQRPDGPRARVAGGISMGGGDLELEAARLHVALKTQPAFPPSLRVVGGGHDWPVWERGIVTALCAHRPRHLRVTSAASAVSVSRTPHPAPGS